jgi:WD40 repeat protein/serine/threonine protein kinase
MAHHLDRIGQQVGDYRLLRWLGGGGFGHVYLAEHIRDRSQVAIKLLHVRLSRSEELKAFINEARTIRLKHAHIVPLLDFGISPEEIPYLVMEYASGGTVRDRYPKGSRVPLAQVVSYAQQIGSALQYAHEQHLIHRDVKPENMLLRADGTVLLSDFGLVTIAHSSDSLSLHQEAVGTIAYMAPEQIQKQARAESDQYSLGVLVYEWIAGRCPFEGTSTEIAVQHVMKPPPSLVAQVPGLSRTVEDVVLKALAKDPKDRFVTVQDFTAALKQAVQCAPAMPDMYKTSPMGHDEQVFPPDTSILSVSSSRKSPALGPQVDWSNALESPLFYGREQEIARLTQWVVQERCRVVSILGMGGIGKSALASLLGHQLANLFEAVLWLSVRDAPPCEDLVGDCIAFFSRTSPTKLPASLGERMDLLMQQLREQRCLLVLDNLEVLLQEGNHEGTYRHGYQGYGLLLQRLAETTHQSCVLLTSREKPREIGLLEGKRSLVRSLRLTGLDEQAAHTLLQDKDLQGPPSSWKQLITSYAGNPLALKIVAETITDLFGGDIAQFLQSGQLIFNGIRALLRQQVDRLSSLEQVLLIWLAVNREWTPFDALLQFPVPSVGRGQVLSALEALRRRSLIECGHKAMFTLQSVVMEYVTDALVEQIHSEILAGKVDQLRRYALEQAQAKDFVRQTQVRLLVHPILARLQTDLGHKKMVEEQLLHVLEQLHMQDAAEQGYGPANVMSLFKNLRGDLRGLDLSGLVIRGAYLQGVEMQDANLSQAHLHQVTFTEALDAVYSVAISGSGQYWATGSNNGEVHIWCNEGQISHLILQAHNDCACALAFSPDEETFASTSWDGTIKLWELVSGKLLWMHGQSGNITSLAFAPDGRTLASSGNEGIQLWELPNEVCRQRLITQNDFVLHVAWSPDGRLLARGGSQGQICLWDTELGTCTQTLLGHTNWVFGLAFAPDGKLLASAGADQTVRLWDVESGRSLQILEGHTNVVMKVSWSPDGRTVASCGYDATVRLWDAMSGHLRYTLLGHTNYVTSLAFAPDGRTLLSGSDDRTLRVWDILSGQCIRVMRGYSSPIFDMAWSPDGSQLVSASSDTTLSLWQVKDAIRLRILQEHAHVVYGVTWHPNGRLIASGSWDNTIRLWDPITGACVRHFENPADQRFHGVLMEDGLLVEAFIIAYRCGT